MATTVNLKTKNLIAKWSKRINLVEKVNGTPLTYEKRAALANALENTNERIRAVEATNPSSIGQYKRYALDVVTATVPNLIAFDMYAVQSMDNRISMINYMDYRYSKTKGSTQAGKVFASSINMGTSDPYYSSDLVKDEVLGVLKDVSGKEITLPWSPVIAETLTIESTDGNVIGTADATGAITGTGITSGTITPDGKITVTFADTTSTADVIVNYRFNNEDVRSDGPVSTGFTNVPEVELKLNSIPVTAQARTLRSFWSFDAQYELQKELTYKVA